MGGERVPMIFDLLASLIEFLIMFLFIYLAGILAAQSLKLLPPFLALSELMNITHPDFPSADYHQLQNLVKMAPFRLLISSVEYTIHTLFAEGILAFIGSLMGMVSFWVIFLIAVFHGLFYIRLRSFLILPVRLVYNLN